jgi:hypothetical protein
MHRGIAPPQGFALSNFLSNKKVSIPAFANVSAAEEPAGPDPTTATRSVKGSSPNLLRLRKASYHGRYSHFRFDSLKIAELKQSLTFFAVLSLK